MRTTLATILFWALATIGLCVAGLWVTSRALDRPQIRGADPMKSLMSMLAEDTSLAYEEGGAKKLLSHLRELDKKLPGERFLVGLDGQDLVDGADRKAFTSTATADDFSLTQQSDGRLAAVIQVNGGRYRFIWVVEPWFGPPSPAPFIVVVVAIVATMGTALALYLSIPLRHLRRVMDRFGRGDLRARVRSRRSDEIGVVSREFDLLAERVEKLVSAERRLLQDVSHELRSPLTRLDVAVDLAIKREERGPLLERIRHDVTRLSELVSELLDLTRSESAVSDRTVNSVSPEELLRILVEDCAIEAETKNCRLVFEAAWPGSVKGNAELLRRAFENVIRNAIRYAPEGTHIDVSILSSAKSVRIIVRDLGPGVPAESLSSIFEPFFRVEGDRSRESGGVGLGLAIARRAVELHGGSIAASNAGPGLSVEISLPSP